MLIRWLPLRQEQPLCLAGVSLVGRWSFGGGGSAVLQWSSPALQGYNLIPDLTSTVVCKFFPGSTLLALLFVTYFFPLGRNFKNLDCRVWSETFYVVKWPCQHNVIKNGGKRNQMSKWLWRRGRKIKIQVWHYGRGGFCSNSCSTALKCFFGYCFRLDEARHYCIFTLGKTSVPPCVTVFRLPKWCHWQNVPFWCTWKM